MLVTIQRLNPGHIGRQLLVEVARILFLNMSTVLEHDSRDIGGRRSAKDRPAKTGLVQTGQVTAVIGMSVRQDHAVKVLGPSARSVKTLLAWLIGLALVFQCIMVPLFATSDIQENPKV